MIRRGIKIMMPFEDFPYTDYHNLNLDWILKRLREVNERLIEVNRRLDEVNARLDEIEDELVAINAELVRLNTLITEIQATLKSHSDAIVSLQDELSRLKSEFTTTINNINSQLSTLTTKVDKNTTDITNLTNKVSASTGDITNLTTKVEKNTTDISTLKNSITSINSQITDINSNISSLTTRVKTLEDLLENLNIIPPVTLYNPAASLFAVGSWAKWLSWKKNLFPSGSPVQSMEYSPNIAWWDNTTSLPIEITYGFVAQPTLLCKLPYIAVKKSAVSTTESTAIGKIQALLSEYSSSLFVPSTLTPSNGFFDITFTYEYGHTGDEVKARGSYIPFMPSGSVLFTTSASDTNTSLSLVSAINTDVRIQIPESGTAGKICVTGATPVWGLVPNADPNGSEWDGKTYDIYLYDIIEIG